MDYWARQARLTLVFVCCSDHRLDAVSASHFLPTQGPRGGLGRCQREVHGGRVRPSDLPQCLPAVEEKRVGLPLSLTTLLDWEVEW